MLLTAEARRTAGHDRESGSALAGVVAVMAATGIIAMTLLAAAMFGTGFTSASRAAVQAQAAAEGGLDYAHANRGLCDPATRSLTSPAGHPTFRVEFSYRTKGTSPWTPGCPPTDATGVRLVSTGTAAAVGAAGHTRGNIRTMEAVYGYEFPFLILGDRSISLTGSLTVNDTVARPADVSTNKDFLCGGGFTLRGVLYVAGSVTSCSGKTIVSSFDTTTAPHALPRLAPGDSRLPGTPGTLTSTGSCTVAGGSPLNLSRRAVQCTAALKLTGVQIRLTGDVVVFAPQIMLDDVTVSSVGGRFSLYFVKPWPSGQVACPAADHVVDVTAKKVVTDDATSLMLYGSTEVQMDSPEGTPVRAQLYGCQVDTKGSPKLAYAPTGPMILMSKRDVTG